MRKSPGTNKLQSCALDYLSLHCVIKINHINFDLIINFKFFLPVIKLPHLQND